MEQREEFDSFQGQVHYQLRITELIHCMLAPFTHLLAFALLSPKIVFSIANEPGLLLRIGQAYVGKRSVRGSYLL